MADGWDERRIEKIEEGCESMRHIVIGNGKVGLITKVETLMKWIDIADKRRDDAAKLLREQKRTSIGNRVLILCALMTAAIPAYYAVVDHSKPPQIIYMERSTVHSTDSDGSKIDSTTSTETTKDKH